MKQKTPCGKPSVLYPVENPLKYYSMHGLQDMQDFPIEKSAYAQKHDMRLTAFLNQN
jgi:hypothetical protein